MIKINLVMKNLIQNAKGLLIDFDGTLCDTGLLHIEAMNNFFKGKNMTQIPEIEAGKSTLKIFEEWGETIENPELAQKYLNEYLKFLPQYFMNHAAKITFFPDAEIFMEKTKNKPRCLVTSSFNTWLSAVDPTLHIFEKFPNRITKDDVLPYEKPHPKSYLLGAEKLGFLPSDCLAIEDSYSGIVSAKRAGCQILAVKRGSEKGFELADYVVDFLDF